MCTGTPSMPLALTGRRDSVRNPTPCQAPQQGIAYTKLRPVKSRNPGDTNHYMLRRLDQDESHSSPGRWAKEGMGKIRMTADCRHIQQHGYNRPTCGNHRPEGGEHTLMKHTLMAWCQHGVRHTGTGPTTTAWLDGVIVQIGAHQLTHPRHAPSLTSVRGGIEVQSSDTIYDTRQLRRRSKAGTAGPTGNMKQTHGVARQRDNKMHCTMAQHTHTRHGRDVAGSGLHDGNGSSSPVELKQRTSRVCLPYAQAGVAEQDPQGPPTKRCRVQ